jgi:preprotein translocase subunit YajC
MFSAYLLAQAQPEGGLLQLLFGNPLTPIILIMFLGYFFMIRPMRRQERERQAMISAMKKNDKVLTSGGIIGVVADIKDKEDEVRLKIDDNSPVRLRVTKSSIVRVLSRDEAPAETKEGKP